MLAGLDAHPHARAVLGSALSGGAIPSHAYLFHGPGGTGKREVARAFAAELLAEGSPDPDGARARASREAHPDLTVVRPTGAADMRVSDVDEPVVSAVARTPFESRRRVFVIESADALNDQAANRLLKTLEEPPAYAHLILVSDRPGDLPETIVSRCQPVRFDPMPTEQIAQRLRGRGIDDETARACAGLALGDAARALELAIAEGPALRADAEALARAALAGELAGAPWKRLIEHAKQRGGRARAETIEQAAEAEGLLSERDRRAAERETDERARRAERRERTRALDEGLRLTGLWLRDVAAVAEGADVAVYAVDRLDALREAAAGRDPHRLRAAIAHVDEARRSLRLNVDEELASEALAYRLERELAGG